MAAATASFLAFSPNTNFTRRYGINKAPTVAAVQSRVSVFANPNPNLRNRGFFAFGNRIGQRISLVVAAFDESKDKDIEVEKERDELKTEANEAQEAWKETLESFKVEALKMKEVSQEAYEVYSKKAMVMLEKTSKTLKIQADKAKEDLSVVAKQISEEGNVYLSAAAENSPESIKDVVETFAASTDELKEMSAVRDYHLGIPYGAFLSVGGFLMFMLTGSIAAIRFGVILGGALLALSVESLRSSKRGESSEVFLKGQTAIATILFLKKWRDFCQHQLFSTALLALVSGGMVAFYVYRITMDSSSKGPSSEQS